MSLSADIADAIIAVDTALARFEQANAIAANSRAYRELKDAIETLQETSLGDGMHFASLEEARAFRNPRPARKFGCGGVHAGEMCNTRRVFAR